MNKRFFSILLFILGGTTLFAQSQMNLDECVKYAVSNHTSVMNAQLGQVQAKSKIAETRAIGLPQANAKIDFMNNIEMQSMYIPANIFNPDAPEDEIMATSLGVQYSSSASITINQMVFNGSYFVGLQAAKTYKQLADQNYLKSVEDVTVSVQKAYYSSLVNMQRLELLEANKAQIEKLVTDAKVLVENGLAEQVELSKLTISYNNILTDIEKVEALQIISDNLLKLNMGMPLSEDLILTESLEDVLLSLEIQNIPAFNVANRTDYKLLQTELDLRDLDVKNHKMEYVPNAGVFLQAGYNNGASDLNQLYEFDRWQDYAIVGAQINIPLFTSGKNSNAVQQKEIDKKIVENQIQNAEQAFELEYQRYVDNYKIYLLSLERMKENMKLAQEVFDNAKIKYQNGLGSNYDLIVAETSLKQAQTAYLSAVYDLLVTKVDLDKVSGNL